MEERRMYYADRKGVVERMKYFSERGASQDCVCGMGHEEWTILHYASFHGCMEVVQTVVENGALDVNVKTSDMRTPLMLALKNGNEDIVKLLIGAGAEFSGYDNEKKTVLHYACSTCFYSREGLTKIVKCIVEKGDTDLNAETIYKWTPLLYAVDTDKEDIVEILIQAGADANFARHPSTMWSVLHYAILKGWRNVVQMIVQKEGCDLNPIKGSIPLHMACRKRNVEIIKLLIAAGADVNFENNSNATALSYRITYGDLESIRLLVQYGAYFGDTELKILYHSRDVKDLVLKDAQLCTQSIINKFNNESLPAVYNIPGFREALPRMETLTIKSDKSMAEQEISNFVDSKIRTETTFDICNVLARPIVLKLICVEWLIKYQSTMKRLASQASNSISFQVKKQRLN